MAETKALIIVDVQNDFCPGGALPVPEGDRVAAPLGRLAAQFVAAGMPVYASRDWHPEHTGHFRQYGGPWPPHCVRESTGAAFHPALRLPEATVILSKGTDPRADGYSAFDGRNEQGQSLMDLLTEAAAGHLYIGGLATDYCVRATVLDALDRGFQVSLLVDCIAGVDVRQGDSRRAMEEMQQAGAGIISTDALLSELALLIEN